MQRVPKKTNEMKSDLQNSTASQGDCSWVGILLYFFGIDRLNIGQILRLTSFAQDDHVGVMTFYKGDCSWDAFYEDNRMETVTLSEDGNAVGVEWV